MHLCTCKYLAIKAEAKTLQQISKAFKYLYLLEERSESNSCVHIRINRFIVELLMGSYHSNQQLHYFFFSWLFVIHHYWVLLSNQQENIRFLSGDLLPAPSCGYCSTFLAQFTVAVKIYNCKRTICMFFLRVSMYINIVCVCVVVYGWLVVCTCELTHFTCCSLFVSLLVFHVLFEIYKVIRYNFE